MQHDLFVDPSRNLRQAVYPLIVDLQADVAGPQSDRRAA